MKVMEVMEDEFYYDIYEPRDADEISTIFKHKNIYYDQKKKIFRLRIRDNNHKLIIKDYKIKTFDECYKIIKDVHLTLINLKRPLKIEKCGCRDFKKAMSKLITLEDVLELHKEVDRVWDGYDSEEFYENIRKKSWKYLDK